MNKSQYKHHDLAGAFPMMEGEAYENLKTSIKEVGQIIPIVLFEGAILDGRNREKACLEQGITPQYEVLILPEGVKPMAFVMAANAHRRHQTEEELKKSIVVLRRLGYSERVVAEMVGTNDTKVHRVMKEVVENTEPSPASNEAPDPVVNGKDGKTYRRTEEEWDVLLEKSKGMTWEEAGKMLGISPDALRCKKARRDRAAREGRLPLPVKSETKPERPETPKEKSYLERKEQELLAKMQLEYQADLKEARAKLQAQAEEYMRLIAEQEALNKQLRDAQFTIDRVMTYDQFKLIRGCLHPDKQPEEARERYNRAFEIFISLEKHVNPNQSREALRRKGWEHLKGKVKQ